MRCSQCVLPDTIPSITFDQKNVCIYCQQDFPFYHAQGDGALMDLIDKGKRACAAADCLVGLSGGKDSTYTLIMLKERLHYRVEAFTYIHDGTVPFSLDNAIKICRRLRVKHHFVTLPRTHHFKVFAGFLRAFLDAPSPTTAGMACVACKHLHIMGSEIARARNIPFIAWSASPLEYSPFLALKLKGGSQNQFSREGTLKGAVMLMREFFKTAFFPITFLKYNKICIKGCLAAFPTSSFLKKHYPTVTPLMFYSYHPWNPKVIKRSITEEYGWNAPLDIVDDWHSDCIFNVFKEYTFQKMYGASYTDAYLSNQIRHDLIDREEALAALRQSKRYFKNEIYRTLDALNLSSLKERFDLTCFDVSVE